MTGFRSSSRVPVTTEDAPADFCDGFVWLSENAPSFGWAKLPFENGARFRFIGKEACAFCDKWFGGSVPLMIEFVSAWKAAS